MSKLDSEGDDVIEREVEMSLIEFLLNNLKCGEEEESLMIKQTDVIKMAHNQNINAEANEFSDLLDLLFNQQSEDYQFNVYQRLVAMISSEMQREEEGEEAEAKSNKNEYEEEQEYQEPDQEMSSKEQKDTQLQLQVLDSDKEVNGINNKPELNTHIINKANVNDIDNENVEKQEAELPQMIEKPISDLDILSDNYIIKKKEHSNKNVAKLLANNGHILNQEYKELHKSNELLNEPLFAKNQFETIIQPSNDFQFPILSINTNPNETNLFEGRLQNNINDANSKTKDDVLNTNQSNNPNAKKLNQPPSQYTQTQKLKRSINRPVSGNPISQLQSQGQSNNQDYFLQLFQSTKSKQIQLLSDKISKVSSKSYMRNQNRDFFDINKHKPSPLIQAHSSITPLRMSNLNKRQKNFIENANYDLPKSYVKQTINQNFNEILKGKTQSRITYSLKTKNFNLKNPKEKQLYMETLKKDIKEFSYQKEQARKSRDDAFGEIDERLEGLMKKNRIGVYSQKENEHYDNNSNHDNNDNNDEDQVNQGFNNQEEDKEGNESKSKEDIKE